MALAESIGLPPPRATMESKSPSRTISTPARIEAAVGSGRVSAKHWLAMPACSSCSLRRAT